MDNLRVITVLGAFNGGNGGGNSGADLTHGGSIDGSLSVSGEVSASQGEFDNLHVDNCITAQGASFCSLYINGKEISEMLAANAAPKAPVPIAEAGGKLKDGYRYLVQPIDDCTEIGLGGFTVCQYAQAEIWIDNRATKMTVYYPDEWLWRDGEVYVHDCALGVLPQSHCGYM